MEGVAILVGQRMVISENQEEHGLVEESETENVVVDGGQDPWGEGRRSDQDGIVSSWDS